LEVARSVAANELPPATRDRILKAVAASPSAAVKDLFDGYQPSDGRERKLGQNPRPKTILALTGDAARGRDLFFAERSKCATCHKIDGQGKEVGPDLSTIAKTRSREFLLESILDPSRRVEPQYQSYLLRTHDGRAFTGLLVRKDGKEVVLKDAEGQEHRVAADNVEKLQPARESLMPTGQVADFTPQRAADLLEYLAGRK
jgi:putative heme-binding domain-containing protein